jgi:hypothetical protein
VNENLMRAVLFASLFFETSTDDECDPDLAVKQLEQIATELNQLSRAQQEQFLSFARRTAEKHPSPAVAKEIISLVDGLLAPSDE